ncbi:MAG: hypothetical protein CVV41_18275 [Candidatus Riflebacteria bacterium HGW-Riflebacteria-1]|nr:MAG: hypothetical protein CVV41_18275 [Candidatus Riflebacteria bacterium HGW-Riflebacteria-1]
MLPTKNGQIFILLKLVPFMRTVRILSISLLAMLLAATLLADSATRLKTDTEKTFFNEVIQACQSATAGIKTTWEEDSRSGDKNDDRITEDSEKYPLVHYFNISWADNAKIQEARTRSDTELAALAPKLQARVASTDTTAFEELANKMGKAAEAGDMVEVARLQKEAEVMAKQMEEGSKSFNQEVESIVEKNLPHDVNLTVRIAINKFYESFNKEPQTGKLSDGTSFYRVEDSRNNSGTWIEGTTFIFLGNEWKAGKDNDISIMQHPEHVEKPSASVRSIVVSVEADGKRALDALNSMNLSALKALIK